MNKITKYVYVGFLKLEFNFYLSGGDKMIKFMNDRFYSDSHWSDITDEYKFFVKFGIFNERTQ